MGDVGQVGPACPAFHRKGVLIPADRWHKKRQLNFMVWKLGQRSLYCPEHLSFRSLGKKTDFLCGRSLRQTKKEISLTFGRARLFSGFLPLIFSNLIKIWTGEIHFIAQMNRLYLCAFTNSNILPKKEIINVSLKGKTTAIVVSYPILLRASFFLPLLRYHSRVDLCNRQSRM